MRLRLIAAADFKGVGLDGMALSCVGDRSASLGGSTFSVGTGGTYRQVLDFQEEDSMAQSVFVSAPGQSGSALGDWYDNHLAAWEDGDYLKMRTTAGAGAGGYAIARTQTLRPV